MRLSAHLVRKAGAVFLTLSLPAFAAPPRPPAAPARARVVVVGWDGGDWKLLDPLVRAGTLPNLAALLAHGRSWDLATFEPMASPLIWTTLATGRTPVEHGVADFQEFDPKTRVKIPVSSRSRRVPALWNEASARGLKVGVVGWWATWPAEKVNGFLVSDRLAPVLGDTDALSRSPALTWPEGLGDGLRLVVGREGAPPYEDVAKGLAVSRADFDAAVRAGKGLEDPITGYRKILGSTRVYARTALELAEREKPDLLMVYFQGTDEIGHLLARYHPPRLAGVSEDDFRKYSGGVVAFYREADRILGDLRAFAAANGASLVLVSDHGFKWGRDRPASRSSLEVATAYLWHESPGILAVEGPAVAPSKVRGKASVFDVAPTLARMLGAPTDPAFEGKPVSGLNAARLPPAAKPAAWAAPVERLAVADGAEDRKAADEFSRKLVSLGYLTGADASAVDARPPDRAGRDTAESLQNMATFLRARGKAAESIPYYEKALEVSPSGAKIWFNLALALDALARYDEADDALVSALKNNYYDPDGAVARHLAGARTKDEESRTRRQAGFFAKASAAFPADDRYRVALGTALFQSKDCAGAERVFGPLAAKKPRDVRILNMTALAEMCLGKTDAARELLTRSLDVDPKQPPIREALAKLSQGGTAR